MFRPALLLILLAFSFCFFLAPGLQAKPSSGKADPVKFVRNLGDQVVQTLEQQAAKNVLRLQYRTILTQYFDVQTIGRFVLGPYWNQATPAQQQRYMTLFQDMIVEMYANRFSAYSGEKFEVLDSYAQSDRDTLVRSRIVFTEGQPIAIGWRVRAASGGQLKIVDVTVEDVSMSATQRAEFASVYQNQGGMEGLLNALQARVNRLNSPSAR